MGKKRRMLSSRSKFGAKHSSHPRMKHIMKTEEAKATAAPVTEPTVVTPPLEIDIPVIEAAPAAVTDTTTAAVAPVMAEATPTTEKTVKAPVIKKTKPAKKKTRRSTTKSKTISRNA